MKKFVWLLFFTGILFAGTTLEINKKYICECFMIMEGDTKIIKNDRNAYIFDTPDIIFEYGSKKSYTIAKGKKTLFRYTKSISNAEVYVAETSSALLTVNKRNPLINIVVSDLVLSYSCK